MSQTDRATSADSSTRAEDALRLWAALWEFSVEMAVESIVSTRGVSRDEALRQIGERIQDEVERDTPAMIRVARALRDDQ